jgi:hypothetical protein
MNRKIQANLVKLFKPVTRKVNKILFNKILRGEIKKESSNKKRLKQNK